MAPNPPESDHVTSKNNFFFKTENLRWTKDGQSLTKTNELEGVGPSFTNRKASIFFYFMFDGQGIYPGQFTHILTIPLSIMYGQRQAIKPGVRDPTKYFSLGAWPHEVANFELRILSDFTGIDPCYHLSYVPLGLLKSLNLFAKAFLDEVMGRYLLVCSISFIGHFPSRFTVLW